MTATFDDGKEDGALRTIGEVGKALNLKPHVLRYWEEQFPMLQPLKRSGNRRYYRPEDVALVETIDRLVNHEGYTLKGAKQAIKEGRVSMADTPRVVAPADDSAPANGETAIEKAPPPVTPVPAASAASPELLSELKGIRERLAAAIGA